MLTPATAARLGLATGEIVRVQVDVRSVEAPVWVLAQQADDVVTLPLGCGRRQAGRVGTGVGFDGCVPRPTTAPSAPATRHKTGRTHAFAVTQHEIDQQARRGGEIRQLAPVQADSQPR